MLVFRRKENRRTRRKTLGARPKTTTKSTFFQEVPFILEIVPSFNKTEISGFLSKQVWSS